MKIKNTVRKRVEKDGSRLGQCDSENTEHQRTRATRMHASDPEKKEATAALSLNTQSVSPSVREPNPTQDCPVL